MISLDSNVRTSYFSVAPICIARKHTRFGLMVKWCASIHHISSAIVTETQFLWGQPNFYEVNPIFHKPSPLFQLFFGWFFHVFSHPHIPTWWWFNRSQNPAAPCAPVKANIGPPRDHVGSKSIAQHLLENISLGMDLGSVWKPPKIPRLLGFKSWFLSLHCMGWMGKFYDN